MLVATLVAAGMSGASALERNTGIWRLLRAAHFPGPMDEWAHAKPVDGEILANGKRYSFWEYDAINKENHHGRSGLLVFEGAGRSLSYLGMYNVALDDFRGPLHPTIRGTSVFSLITHTKSWARNRLFQFHSRMVRQRRSGPSSFSIRCGEDLRRIDRTRAFSRDLDFLRGAMDTVLKSDHKFSQRR